MTNIERRYLQQPVKIETRADVAGKSIAGYGSIYYDGTPGTEHVLWAGMVERFLPGCFDQTLSQDDIRCQFNHDPSLILGRNKSGTLKLTIDGRGLYYECQLPDSPNGQNVLAAIERRDVDGSSVGMVVHAEEWTEDKARGVIIRSISRVQLYDVSPVTYPAYAATTAETRDALNVRARAALQVDRDGVLRRLELSRLTS